MGQVPRIANKRVNGAAPMGWFVSRWAVPLSVPTTSVISSFHVQLAASRHPGFEALIILSL